MKGNLSSPTHNSKKHYSGVSQQQGRVELDADWNENIVGFVEHTTLRYTWQDIVIPNYALSQLKEIASKMSDRKKIYKKCRFITKLKYRRGIIALFTGPSGTGKTMAAEVIASRLKLDMYRIDLSQVVNKYIGETEKNLKKVFDAAKQSGAILFFDKADALFGKRTEIRDSHDRYKNTSYILHHIENYNGLTILANNRNHKEAKVGTLLSRINFAVNFPEKESSEKIDPGTLELLKVNYNNLHESIWNNFRFSWIVTSIFIPVLFAMLGFLVKEYDDVSKMQALMGFFVVESLLIIWLLIMRIFEHYNRVIFNKLKVIENRFNITITPPLF